MKLPGTPQMQSWKWTCQVESDDSYRELDWDGFSQLVEEGKITSDSWVKWQGLSLNGISLEDLMNNSFFFEDYGKIIPVPSEQELNQLASDIIMARIKPTTRIWGKDIAARGLLYKDFRAIPLVFIPEIEKFTDARADRSLTVFSGPNNCGKSIFLKYLHHYLGSKSILLACNRFYHFSELPQAGNDFDMLNHFRSSQQNFYQSRDNTENSSYPLAQVISSLSDDQRSRLFSVCSNVFGEQFRVIPRFPGNQLTKYYVVVGDVELSHSSTGTRLFLLLLGALMSTEHETVLIDEPEIGLSPSLQRKLAKTIYDPSIRKDLFPGIQSLYVVTHSHHFLDHVCFDNNFSVSRSGVTVNLNKINNITELHDLVFNMLGDDLTSLSLPEVIILVEGPSDVFFFRKILTDIFPGVLISLVNCGGDGEVAKEFKRLCQVFPDFHCTPYRNRTIIVLDAKNNTKTAAFTRAGIPDENIVRLKKNGIEYYYPTEILSKIFGVSEDICLKLELDNNNINIGGVSKSKLEIAKNVVSNMTSVSEIDEEIIREIVEKVGTIIGRESSNNCIKRDC